MIVCEAAGFDIVIVETVGVGQSEVAVAGMVDLFVLLLAPGAGDDLQGVKRGIVELAELVVVNKFDGALADLARHTAADYSHALHFVGTAQVLLASALEGTGIVEVWATIASELAARRDAGVLATRRAAQAREWMWSEVTDTLLDSVRSDARVRDHVDALEADVVTGSCSPTTAARRILAALDGASMTSAEDVLAATRSVLLIDYPGRAGPEAFARAGYETSAHEGPGDDEYYAYTRDGDTIVRSHVGAPPTHVDLVYTYRPVDELPAIVAFAYELGAHTVWFAEANTDEARTIVEGAGLHFVGVPDAVALLS
jgi:hypothetical protein